MDNLLISGTNSDVSGRFSATANINTENANSTVIPVNNESADGVKSIGARYREEWRHVV
ncbi:hypothetical protein DPMN_086506 [Dreissena polymorpha]|uniref:Uncharacterized protein n=1 Tax=Dreissena polymorpha TaxID=45954 RepID=A0A9D4KQK1_DREPO|nr:hypothetical protein DPMN_086506 [Dreissena polymorpha]